MSFQHGFSVYPAQCGKISTWNSNKTYIEGILHGRAEIRNFSSSVEKYFASERSERVKYFFNTRREISYPQAAM